MKKYLMTDTETGLERYVLAHSVLEAVWILFGPGGVRGTIGLRRAEILCGESFWNVEEREG